MNEFISIDALRNNNMFNKHVNDTVYFKTDKKIKRKNLIRSEETK